MSGKVGGKLSGIAAFPSEAGRKGGILGIQGGKGWRLAETAAGLTEGWTFLAGSPGAIRQLLPGSHQPSI